MPAGKKFLAGTKQDPSFTSRGFTYWKEGLTLFKKHTTTECQCEAVEVLSVLPQCCINVGELQSAEHVAEKAKNWQVFTLTHSNLCFRAWQGRRLHDNAVKRKRRVFIFVKQRFGASTRLRKREVDERSVCNDYWIHVKLMREAWVTINGSTWKAISTAILSSETTWLPAENAQRFRFWVFTRGNVPFLKSPFLNSPLKSLFSEVSVLPGDFIVLV